MKCFLFIITLFSIGRFIYTQGEDDADSDSSGTEVTKDNSSEESEDNPSEESEASTNDDKYDSKGDESASKQERRDKNKETPLTYSSYTKDNILRDEMQRFLHEFMEGDKADLIGQNQHVEQSNFYGDLGRRSVAQDLNNIAAENADYLTPEKAPPELVLLVAKESALLRAGKYTDLGNEFDRKKLLRSGDYWNGVWKEEVKPKSAMRSASQKKKLGSIKAMIKSGTELYKVVSQMKKISPQLLYVINKKQP